MKFHICSCTPETYLLNSGVHCIQVADVNCRECAHFSHAQQTMIKKQVVAYLGKSDRQVSNYVAAGRLSVKYVSVNGIRVGEYDESEVSKLKVELDSEARPATVVRNAVTPISGSADTSGIAAPETPKTLAALQPEFPIGQGSVELFTSALSESLTRSFKEAIREGISIDPEKLASKLVLTIPEAMAYSGFKEKPIRDAIKSGELPSIHIGRSKQVRPNDLRRWVDGKFATPK